ncbi:MAG: threonylcarbamoyl-AMP synthase [Deltaproteobacteria bacterium]|jgi:L-threonylcarbamoyladenylate synthase|nr:threonylcarbamoyl-AMP synthase [Deltaproteobacteria bacterium]
MTELIQINPREPYLQDIDRAVGYLKKGEVIAYPTETIYGLGADVLDRKAVKKIYDLKSRDYGLPIAILIADLKMLRMVASEVSDRALNLVRKFWPGALTILFPASDAIPKGLVTNTGKVGVRISSHPIASAIVQTFGRPITTTSANLSGFPPSLSIKHVKKYFKDKLPCIVDGGECEPSRGSTVVDLSDESMRIIREGMVPAEDVIRCFQG